MMLAVLVLCFLVAAILLLPYISIKNEIDDLIGLNVKLIGLINNVHNDLIASTQEITKEITDSCNMLMVVKKEALENEKHTEELYNNAIEAMRSYAGKTEDDNK